MVPAEAYAMPQRAADCHRIAASHAGTTFPFHSTLFERWDKLVCGPCHNAPPSAPADGSGPPQPMKQCRMAAVARDGVGIASYTWATVPASSMPHSEHTTPTRTAACVVGGARTFAEAVVQESLELHLPAASVDLFLYLFFGEELSARGQGAETAASAQAVRSLRELPATRRAIAMRIQLKENDFRCGQMSTGRFYKIARCAEMITAHAARQPAAPYAHVLVIRPDVLYFSSFTPPPAKCLPTSDDASAASTSISSRWVSYQGEVLVTPMANLGMLMDLENLKCCNITARKPRGCFNKGLDAPWMQFLFRQHFQRHRLTWLQSGAQSKHATGQNAQEALRRRYCYNWPHAILRPSDATREVPMPAGVTSWQNLTNQHGVYRQAVATDARPPSVDPVELLKQLDAPNSLA